MALGGKRAKQPDRAPTGNGAASDCAGTHPFDRWLMRELAALHPEDAAGPLPDEMSDLATRLEARLRAIRARRGEPSSK